MMVSDRYFQNAAAEIGMTEGEMLNSILLKLGQLQAGVDMMRDDFADEKRSAAESRAAVHRRLDDQAKDIGEIRTCIALVSTKVDDAARHNEEVVKPAVADWKQMKSIGIGFVGLLALGGLSVGGFVVWAGEAAVNSVRHWLRIT